MDMVLPGLPGMKCIIDGMTITNKDEAEHLQILDAWHWTKGSNEAFRTVKKLVTSDEVPTHYDPN